ncbi:hypothetical protein LAZ67_1003999 [Cordylochernes scorpioides]|uniref:Endonuclease/exonuclease/phosphatase domain-containing protein n=1 Tax=Cordylochernes scorpioides TaxID=51811 RepID=A0ABY6JY32_9ARAC|nr:hypothetical protein LAZ67_1003999 [Cordylochernes scorpioides]
MDVNAHFPIWGSGAIGDTRRASLEASASQMSLQYLRAPTSYTWSNRSLRYSIDVENYLCSYLLLLSYLHSITLRYQKTQIVVNHLMNSGYPRNFILRHFYNPQQQLSSQTYRSTCIIPYSAHSVNIARYLKNKHGIRTFYTNTPKLETIVENYLCSYQKRHLSL